MKIHLRILAYVWRDPIISITYLVAMFMSIILGIANFVIIIPFLNILFDQVDPSVLESMRQRPDFTFSTDYVIDIFNFYLAYIIDTHGRLVSLYYLCGFIFVMFLLSNGFRYVEGILLALMRANVMQYIRRDFFARVLHFPLRFFHEHKKGDLLSRFSNDVGALESAVPLSFKVCLRYPFTILGCFFILFSISVKLSLITILVLPISAFFIAYVIRKVRKKASQRQSSLGFINNILEEAFGGITLIKAFTVEDHTMQKFERELTRNKRINISIATKTEATRPISEILSTAIIISILLLGGSFVIENNAALEASAFITFLIVYSQVISPLKKLSTDLTEVQKSISAGERIYALIDKKISSSELPNAGPIQHFNSHIAFEHVDFAYDETPVLHDLQLRIEKNTTVALVGPSGGGKSTIASLLLRFYEPIKGAITLDGKDMNHYTVSSIRKLMGYVAQEVILFHDTIHNNIAFGMPEASEEAVIQAAQVANAHAFIMQSPQGYQTLIGEQGLKLSGGQRQRISIARTVLKNPEILIMDEATSALDTESEHMVQEAFHKIMKNRTAIVIAHRLSTIQKADKIIVIKEGRLIEEGTHRNLIRQDSFYKKLVDMQSFVD